MSREIHYILKDVRYSEIQIHFEGLWMVSYKEVNLPRLL